MLYSFGFFLLLFVAVGLYSARYSQKTTEDYLLASKSVKPSLVAFSFFATENSGFMFVGLIGLIFAIGMSAWWVLIGWYTGEIFILWRTARILREHNDKINTLTYSELLSKWTGQEYKLVRYFSAVIIILFLSVYAAAQLSAGGKALNVLAGWDLNMSAVIGFIMVLAYCVAGGIRATIWTDAVQTFAMLGSLMLICWFAVTEIGGIDTLFIQLSEADPELMNMMSGSYKFGIPGFFLGWLFGGAGVLGQPHNMIRFMVIDKAENIKKVLIYYALMVVALCSLCMLAGLCVRAILPDLATGDPELGLPLLSAQLMPGVLSGLFLAGLFAAAMSSADSQILSSSAALTRDIIPGRKDSIWWSKAGTILVAVLALVIALSGNKNVFKLMTFGWSVMAAGMGPLLFIYTLGKKPSQWHVLCMMAGGVAASIYWELAGLSGDMYNVLPGVAAGLLIYFIPAALTKSRA